MSSLCMLIFFDMETIINNKNIAKMVDNELLANILAGCFFWIMTTSSVFNLKTI